MKRFFQPAAPDPGKRPKVGDAGAGAGTGASIAQTTQKRDPLSFVTWNANSLLGRLRKSHDKDALFEYLRRKDLPDVICVQETWLPAAGPNRRGTLKDDTKVARDDRALLDLCFRQKPLSAYTPYYACADIKRAGTAVFVKKDLAVRSVSRSLVGSLAAKAQHDEGRVLVIEFEHFVLLNTYAQNNGWSPESFAKRRRWDAEVDAFIGQIDSSNRAPRPTFPDGTLKPLIWTGDLNVCHKDIDVTHPRFFATQKPEGRKGKPPEPPPSDPNDFGQPGFTPNERKRFDDIVRSRGLVDAYRRVHGDVKDAMTWVGHPGVVAVGKYRGKGMRLDYFMVEAAIAGRIDVCEQATDGTGVGPLVERPDAAFFGSDHCAVYMRLKDEEEEEVVGESVVSDTDRAPGLINFVGVAHQPIR